MPGPFLSLQPNLVVPPDVPWVVCIRVTWGSMVSVQLQSLINPNQKSSSSCLLITMPTTARGSSLACGGPHAGSWLGALPVGGRCHHCRIGLVADRWLALRLLGAAAGRPRQGAHVRRRPVRLPVAQLLIDPYGAHYGSGCKVGDRGAAWTARHEMGNNETVRSCRAVGQTAVSPRGDGQLQYLGQAAITSVNGG